MLQDIHSHIRLIYFYEYIHDVNQYCWNTGIISFKHNEASTLFFEILCQRMLILDVAFNNISANFCKQFTLTNPVNKQ